MVLLVKLAIKIFSFSWFFRWLFLKFFLEFPNNATLFGFELLVLSSCWKGTLLDLKNILKIFVICFSPMWVPLCFCKPLLVENRFGQLQLIIDFILFTFLVFKQYVFFFKFLVYGFFYASSNHCLLKMNSDIGHNENISHQ